MKEQLNKLNQRLRVSLSIMVLSICTIFLLLSNSATAQTNIEVPDVPVSTDGYVATVATVTIPLATGQTNVYEISNVDQLRALSHYVMNGGITEGKVFNLTADIDFDALPTERKLVYVRVSPLDNNSTNFMPIGGWSRWINTSTPATDPSKIFKGAFNGNGHTIKGLEMQVSTLNEDEISTVRDYIGLFGINAGTIMNVRLYTPLIKGHYSVGGICGDNYGLIMNSYTVGNTIYGRINVAGIAGYNKSTGIITHCFSLSGASADESAGGICGHNMGKLFTCYAVYNALVGTSEYYTTVENCYYKGTGNDPRFGTGLTDATLKSPSFVTTLNTTPVSIKYIGERNYKIMTDDYPVLDFTASTPSSYTIYNGEEYIVPNGTNASDIPNTITIKDGGSLVNNGDASLLTNKTINVERQLKAGAWNLVGSVLNNSKMDALNSNLGVTEPTYQHDMAAVKYDYSANAWNSNYLYKNDPFTAGNGFFVYPLNRYTSIGGNTYTDIANGESGYNENIILTQTKASGASNLNVMMSIAGLNLTNNGPVGGSGTITGKWFALSNPYTKRLKVHEDIYNNLNIQGEDIVYIYNPESNSWVASTSSSYIYPGYGFMVATASDASILTTRSSKSAIENITPSYITFTCQANNTTKEAFARISEQASNGFDNKDAYVLLSTNNEDLVEPYFLVENHTILKDIFKTMPYTVPMNFHASKVSNTNLTVSNIPNDVSVSIVDLSNGQETALENGSTFNFVANQGENEGRFVVKFGKNNVSIENTAEENEISLAMYPNPATTNTTLFVDGLTNDAQVFVNDIQGRTIHTYTINKKQATLKINTSNLASGIYYIRVVCDTLTKTEKLVVK